MSAPTPNLVSSGPALSLLLPTRARVHLVRRLLDSIAATVRQLDRIEVVLYIDCDDTPSHGIEHDRLSVVKLIRPPAPMGVMTRACYDASRGRTIMLLNDDTICRTAGWDDAVISALERFDDGVAIVWCNDLFRGRQIPNFPALSRTLCDLMDGPCPADYQREYIDTHLLDIFDKLRRLGHDRLAYLEEIVLEHLHVEAGKADLDATAVKPRQFIDELTYIAWEPQRRIIADRLAAHIHAEAPCN